MLVILVLGLATPASAQKTAAAPPSTLLLAPPIGGTVIPQVTPDGASVTASVGANSYGFTVRNGGTGVGTMFTIPTCSGAVSGCTAPSSFTLLPGASRTVIVSYTGSSAGGTGTVTLRVDATTGGSYDQGYITVTVPTPPPTYNVSVTPDGGAHSMAAGTSSYNFTVNNTGTGDATYTLAPSCAGMMSGCSAPASVYVPHGTSAPVAVSFSDATPGTTGTVSLTASYGGYSDGGSLNVSVNNSYAVSVTPDNQSQIVSGSVNFYVINLGSVQTTFQFSVNCGCSLSVLSATVSPGYSSGVNVTVTLNGYAGTVVLTASDSPHGTSDTGSIIVTGPTYTVSVGPDGYPDMWLDAGQAGTANFTVSNGGNSPATYYLSGSCDPVATGCSAFPGSVPVGAGTYASVPITFTAGAAGSSGYIRLNSNSPSSDAGSVHVIVASHTAAVTPPAPVSVDPGSYTASFDVRNTGNAPTTYNLTATCGAPITGCPGSLGQITVLPGATTQVGVSYTGVNRGDVGTVTLNASWVGNAAVYGTGAMSVTVKHSYAIAVTPDNQALVVSPLGSVTFRLANLGSIDNTFSISVNCASCGISPSTSIIVPKGGITMGRDVTVSLNGYTGTVVLKASDLAHAVSDTGSIIIAVPTYTVLASPDTNPQTVAQPIDANKPGSQTFNIYNAGNSLATYTIVVSCPPSFFSNCSWPATFQVPSLTTLPLPVSFTAASGAGVGTMTLTASAQNTSDQATARWQVNTHYSLVTPNGGTANAYVGGGRTQVFSVKNTGNVTNSYTLTTPCLGTVTGCSASPASISNLTAGNSASVTVTYTGSGLGAGTARLATANTVDPAAVDTGSVTVTVKPTYTVAVTPDGATPQAEAGSQAVVPFSIANSGTTSGLYNLILSCAGAAVNGTCQLDAASIVIAAGQAAVVNVRFQAGAPGATANMSVTATSADDAFFTDPGSATLTVTKYAASVTPDSLAVAPAAYANDTRAFTVTNTGTTQRTFRVQAACAPPAATACSANSTILTLAPNGGASGVNVSYTAGDPGTSGTVRLVATDTLGSSADGGTLTVTVGTSVANNQVQFKQINPGTTIERGQCLVFSIVPDVADECGALRIVHPLPAVTTLGKVRVPTLIYSSDQLQGPTLAVNVILADTTTIPQWVQLTIVRTWPDAHIDTLTRQYPGTDWQAGANRRRRIAVPNVASGGIGILRYSVSVSLVYAGIYKLAAPVDNSELAFVDRTNSAFGAGWWLAGLEQLFPGQYDGSVLWVAGDGSTRKYVNQHTASGADTVFLAAALGRPDTLLLRPDGKYRRQAGNGLYVEFDGYGLHKRTVNRLLYETKFNYENGHLSTLQLPPWQDSTPKFTYAFTFNPTSQLLDAVTAPTVDGKVRMVVLTHSGAVVQTITEQLGESADQVVFQPGTGLKYASRSDRRAVQTSFAYEASSPTIASFATATGAGTDTVRHTFRTAGAIGAVLGTSANLDTVYFRYDGPRPAAVGDTTLFWLDRFGAPTRIVDAMGHETRIARGDPRFPGLATEMRGPAPNNFTTWASYDDRGNLLTSTQANPHGDAIPIDATTTFLWHPKWDMVTRIVQPEGEVTSIAYNDTTGNRVSQDDGRGLMSRVNFQYYSTTDPTIGAMKGLLSAVVLPSTATLSTASSVVKYDGLGNVNTTVTPRGTMAVTTNDSIGRTIAMRNQISDAGDTTSTGVTYDLSDRVTRSVSYGPPLNGSSAHLVTVDNAYDREGRLQSVTRSQSPDPSRTTVTDSYPALGTLVSRYTYDDLGRKVAAIAPDSTPGVDTDNPVDYTFYDLAGNVDSVRTRRNDHVLITDTNHVIKMTYDALNRLKTRIVPDANYRARVDGYAVADAGVQDTVHAGYNTPYPRFFNNNYYAANEQPNYHNWGGYTVSGFTATYDYDAAGNMTIADNADARVRRRYYPNGQVRYDSLYTKTLQRDTVHSYVLEYLYDRDGRTTTLNHPAQLSGGTSGYQTTMQYEPLTGALSKVVDPLGNAFTYGYDARSQVLSLTMPTGVSEMYDYDQEGDMLTHWAGAPAANTPFPGTVHDVKMSYDRRGKMATLWNAVAAKDTVTMAYSGLGYLVYNDHATWLKSDTLTRYQTTEHFTFDPLGNRLHSDFTYFKQIKAGNCGWFSNCYTSTSNDGDQADWYYRLGTGRLVFDDHFKGNHQNQTKYDDAGNIVFSTQKPNSSPTVYEDRASFYGADGTLAAVDYRQISQNNQFFHTVFDEYRYDALGRRVMVRSQRRCGSSTSDAPDCNQSYVRRTVWAGAQELYEIQMPDNATARENDTGAVAVKALENLGYDPNPLYGRVAFTFGLKLDQPLSVTRLRYMNSYSETWAPFSIVPLWTVRGTADTSYFAAMGKYNCNGNGRCVQVSYQDEYWTPAWRRFYAPPTFQGTLLTDKADHTGQLFRRNRYYDPATGRFTQEDPIGLAGGINEYGFAGGDPVNFSDPMGTCKVDVRFSPVIHGYHAYILATAPDATRVASRGGPEHQAGGSSAAQGSSASGGASTGSSRGSGSSGSSNSGSPGASAGNGSSGPWGALDATGAQPYDKSFVDFDSGNPPSQRVVDNDEPCDKFNASFSKTASQINAANIAYNPLSTNSNAVVTEMLRQAGIKVPAPIVTAHGWGTRLVP